MRRTTRHRQPALISNGVSYRFRFLNSIVNCGELKKGPAALALPLCANKILKIMDSLQKYSHYREQIEAVDFGFDLKTYFIDDGTPYGKLLLKDYEFFQGYLDQQVRDGSAFFIFGSEEEYNALAVTDEKINIVSINFHLFLGIEFFYNNNHAKVENIISTFCVPLNFDGELSTVTIMKDTAKMFVFYHELGHLVQSFRPSMLSNYTDEVNTDEYEEMKHVSEIDADLYAANMVVSHILCIANRDKGIRLVDARYYENLCIAIISSFTLFRNLTIGNVNDFYLKERSHPHTAVRVFNVYHTILDSLSQNIEIQLDWRRILEITTAIDEKLCIIHPEIRHSSNLQHILQNELRTIVSYCKELMEIVVSLDSSAFNKKVNADKHVKKAMKNEEIDSWDLNYDISDKIDIEVLKRNLFDARDRFISIEDSFKVNKSRAFTILAILLSILGVLINALLKNVEGLSRAEYNSIYVLICLGLGVTIYYIFVLVKIIKPKGRIVAGELPSRYNFGEMAKVNIEKQEVFHIISDLESYDYNIKYNENLLQEEVGDLESAIVNIPLSFAIILLVSMLIIIFT